MIDKFFEIISLFSIFKMAAPTLHSGSLKYLCNFLIEQEILHSLIKFYEDRLTIMVSIENFRFFNIAAAAIVYFGKGKLYLLIQLTILHSLVERHDDRSTFTENISDVRFSKWRLPSSLIL